MRACSVLPRVRVRQGPQGVPAVRACRGGPVDSERPHREFASGARSTSRARTHEPCAVMLLLLHPRAGGPQAMRPALRLMWHTERPRPSVRLASTERATARIMQEGSAGRQIGAPAQACGWCACAEGIGGEAEARAQGTRVLCWDIGIFPEREPDWAPGPSCQRCRVPFAVSQHEGKRAAVVT